MSTQSETKTNFYEIVKAVRYALDNGFKPTRGVNVMQEAIDAYVEVIRSNQYRKMITHYNPTEIEVNRTKREELGDFD